MTTLKARFSESQVPILLGVAFVILLAVGGLSLLLANRTQENFREVTHTLEVQNALSEVLLSMRRAESVKRGYVLTDQPRYLEVYNEARAEVRPILERLRDKVSDNPDQVANLAEVERLIAEKIAEMDQTLDLHRTNRRDEATTLIREGLGQRLQEALRERIGRMQTAEAQLLDERNTSSDRAGRLLLLTTLFGLALIATIRALSVLLMQRANRQRQNALTELAGTNANLENIVSHRTADLTEANEEIQRFAYIVSHDLRSPLVNIMGFTSELEALRGDIFTEITNLRAKVAELEKTADGDAGTAGAQAEQIGKDFDEALGFIKSSITKMDRLINAVLRLSREGRRDFRPEPIDMTAMLRQLEASVAHQAQEANADIVVGDLPEVSSDRLALEQVFSNLLDNAVKYLKRGERGHIEVRGSSTPKSVIYEVRDNGRGIDPADHQRIFELFRRSGQQDRPGEGIGLAHVRALVRRLGGNLTVTSELGQGSVFTVTLPRRWKGEERKAA